MSCWCWWGFGRKTRGNLGVCRPVCLVHKESQDSGVQMVRLGDHPTPAEARQTCPAGPVPTWDVEMARSLLVGGGGRLAVGQHREAGCAPAAFTASRRKGTDRGWEEREAEQSISSMKTYSRGAGLSGKGLPMPLPGVGICAPHQHFHLGSLTC